MSDEVVVQPPSLIERYEKLRLFLGLDLLALEDDFMTTPRVLEDIAELAARAEMEKNIAKHNLDLATSIAADRIRQPWIAQSAAQGRIDSELRIMVPLAPEVREAREAYTLAIHFADLCAGLFTSMKEQSRLLGKGADMLNSGYIRPSMLTDQRRTELREAHRKLNEETGMRIPRPRS